MNALEKALRLPGLPKFFCGRSKRPTMVGGFHNATDNPEQLRRLYEMAPGDLIGVPAGVSFVVVDPDLQHRAAREWWKANKNRLPVTRMHRTGSGGWHLLFKPHPDFRHGVTVHEHVDTRGAGGYIIWWPAQGCPVLNHNVLADVPDWIIEAMPPESAAVIAAIGGKHGAHMQLNAYLADARSAEAAFAGILRRMARAHSGERQSLTWWCANRVFEMIRDGALHPDAVEALTEVALSTGIAPWRVQEVMRRVERNILS